MSSDYNNEGGLYERAGAAVLRANQMAEKTRKDFENWLYTSLWGVAFDILNCVLSLLSVSMYVVQTYFDERHGEVREQDALLMLKLEGIELWLTFFFLVDYVIFLYAAERRTEHVMAPLNIIDLVTILPALISFSTKMVAEMYQGQQQESAQSKALEQASSLNFLRFVRVLKLLRVLRLLRSINRKSKVTAGGDVFRRVSTMVLTGLSLIFCFAGLFQVVEMGDGKPLQELLDIWGAKSFYYHDALYFTIITISTVGYGDYYPTTLIGKICTMIMILGSLATITDQVNKLVELLSMSSPYARATYAAKKVKHVLICGTITPATIHDFLEEFFHRDHGSLETKVIIMGNTVPSVEMQGLLTTPDNSLRCKWLEGSVLVDSDLVRCDASKAICTFIFCDKTATSSEDVYAEDSTNIMRAISITKFVSAQTAGTKAMIVLQLLNAKNRHRLAVSTCGDDHCQVICLDEIKMNLLGKSCICPGFSTVICNLMISASAAQGTEFEPWFQEYVSGCGQEIYCTNISPQLAGKSFSQAVFVLYRECNCLLFAIEIVDKEGFSRVVLNPATYVIPDTSPKVFLIAQDSKEADEVREYGLDEEQLEAMDEAARLDEALAQEFGLDETKIKYPAEQTMMAMSWQIRDRLQKTRHVVTESRPLESAVVESVEFLQGHVLVCGCPSSIAIFVNTLRPLHIPVEKIMPIVFLHETPPAADVWAEVSRYPQVYIILGSPLETKDLVRAGVLTLSRAIIMRAPNNATLSAVDSGSEGGAALNDADALFTYQSIAKVRPGVPIVCEIDNGANVTFLCASAKANDEKQESWAFTMTAPFASGAVYVDSLQDKLSVQAYYNTNLLRIIRELVIGQAEDGEYSEYNVLPSHLTFTRVPPQFNGKSFIQLFEHLMLKNLALPIAVYRSAPWGEHVSDSQMPYVLTNPNSDLLMNSNDFLYTLDSKMSGDSVMEVCVLRGRNFGSFTSHPNGWACKVNFTVLAKFENKHGKREAIVGSGQLSLSHPSELGESFSDKIWVELEIVQPTPDEDDEAFEHPKDQQQNKGLTRTSNQIGSVSEADNGKPAIYVMVTYSQPKTEEPYLTAGEEPCLSPRVGGNTSGDEKDAESQDTSSASILSQRLSLNKHAQKHELEKEQEREQVQKLVLEELSRAHTRTKYPSDTVIVPRAHAHHAQHVTDPEKEREREQVHKLVLEELSRGAHPGTVYPSDTVMVPRRVNSSDTVIVPRTTTPHTMTGNDGTENVFFRHVRDARDAHHAQHRREADIDADMIILATEESGQESAGPMSSVVVIHRSHPLEGREARMEGQKSADSAFKVERKTTARRSKPSRERNSLIGKEKITKSA